MCTLTIYSGKKRCVVTMNRDELRTRKEAGVLYSKSSNASRLFYPVDLRSGGTWFGANNKGVILCLLNRYQAPEMINPKSRGTIIPQALEQGGVVAVSAWLESVEFSQYNPFDLFLVTKKKIIQFSWDSSTYKMEEIEVKNWFIFTSSSMLTEEVIAFRQNIFKAWTRELGKKLIDADEVIRGFHLIQTEGLESHSVLMEREKSHTRSVIQAELMGKELTLKYMPEILANSADAPLSGAHIEKIQIVKSRKL